MLEIVDGPTLADRIAEGALPVDEAIKIARQITEALEAAHLRLEGDVVELFPPAVETALG